MKTIEERALETYPKGIGVFTSEGAELLQKAYIHGATEQKAIDDADRDTAVYNLLMLKLDDEKKLWLEKACEWLREYAMANRRTLGLGDLCEEFRKAMEE